MSESKNPADLLSNDRIPHRRVVEFEVLRRRFYDVRWGMKGPPSAPDHPVKDLHIQFFLSKEAKARDIEEVMLLWPEINSVFPQMCVATISEVFAGGSPLSADNEYPFHIKQIDMREHPRQVGAVSWNLIYSRASELFIDPKAVVQRFLDALDRRLLQQLEPAPAE